MRSIRIFTVFGVLVALIAAESIWGAGYADASSAEQNASGFTQSFAALPGAFTFIAIPDTQAYAAQNPAIFNSQTNWIVNNRVAENLVFASHLGDIVEYYNNTTEWTNADTAMDILEDPVTTGLVDGFPYTILPGNHDTPRNNYNAYFPATRYRGKAYYGGNYLSDNNEYSYAFFQASGFSFIVISLGNDPPASVIDWADSLLKTYRDRRAIVVTHSLIWTGEQAPWFPSGQAIFNGLSDNPNLFLLLGGHARGEGKRVDTGLAGQTVYTLMADYTNQNNGNLRRLEFSPDENLIHVRTYSPWSNTYESDADSQFDLYYPMTGAASTPTPTVAQPPTATRTQTLAPTATSTVAVSPTATSTKKSTPLPSSTATRTSTPTATTTISQTGTATATNTVAPTRTPTRTATPPSTNSVHIGDLDGSTTNSSNYWNLSVTITVHNASHTPISGASIRGAWSDNSTTETTCNTNAKGQCVLNRTRLSNSLTSMTFTVSQVTLTGYTYLPASNHDPEIDSDGTSIKSNRPV